jgi:hypothetical protein
VRTILGPKKTEVAEGWRKLHNEDFHNMYAPPDLITVIKSRRMRWAGHVPRMRDMRSTYVLLVGKAEGKRLFGRSVCRQV